MMQKEAVVRAAKKMSKMFSKSEWLRDEKISVSLIILIDGGAERLSIEKRNHQNVMLGEISNIPFIIKMFRVWEFIYMIVTKKKSLEDVKPWASIIKIAAETPVYLKVIVAAMTSPIWATEE